jgi:hypothetical protein
MNQHTALIVKSKQICREKNDLLRGGVMEGFSVELGLDELLIEDVQVAPLIPFCHRRRLSPQLLQSIRDGERGGGGSAGDADTRARWATGATTWTPASARAATCWLATSAAGILVFGRGVLGREIGGECVGEWRRRRPRPWCAAGGVNAA